MARTPRDVHVVLKVDTSKLDAALAAYQDRLERLSSIEPCHSAWPADPPGPGYLGTQCQLLDGHELRDGTKHRHRMMGTQVTVEW